MSRNDTSPPTPPFNNNRPSTTNETTTFDNACDNETTFNNSNSNSISNSAPVFYSDSDDATVTPPTTIMNNATTTNNIENNNHNNNNNNHNNNSSSNNNNCNNNDNINTKSTRTNLLFGDSPTNKNDNATRILFWNVNGFAYSELDSQCVDTTLDAKTNKADIVAFAETKLNWHQKHVRRQFKKAINHHYEHSTITTACSNSTSKRPFQPGGVATVIAGHLTGWLRPFDEDALGRWTATTLQGTHNNPVTIITAYIVPHNSRNTAGPLTAWQQQWAAHRVNDIDDPDPRRLAYRDLTEYCKQKVQQKHQLLIMMDANDDTSTTNTLLSKFITAVGLVDITFAHHGAVPHDFSTYNRGRRQVDYAFATPGILPYVTQSGILAFTEYDHRQLFVDVTLKAYFDSAPVHNPAVSRGISASNPVQCEQYVAFLDKLFDELNIEHRIQNIPDDVTAKNYLQQLDRDITKAMLQAERECTKFPSTPWSPALMRYKKTVKYWKMWVSELKTHNDLSQQRQYLCDTWHVTPGTPSSLADAHNRHKAAVADSRTILKHANDLRLMYLEQRADWYAEHQQFDKAQILTRLRKLEQRRQQFLNLQYIFKPRTRSGLTNILIPSDDGTWTSIDDPAKVPEYLIKRNQAHYSQSTGTPCTAGALREFLGDHADTPEVELLLHGHFSPTQDQHINTIFTALSTPLPPVSPTISVNDLVQGFRVWREDTSTSPSGRHLSLYKALITVKQTEHPLFKALAFVINQSVQHQVILPRWREITCLMLEKIPGTPKIDKLRVIQLIEADVNLLYGIVIGRRLLWNAEKHQVLGNAQWGSRPGRSAIEASLMTQLKYETCVLQRTKAGFMFNDAKSCYDRIVMNLAAVRARQLGLPLLLATHVTLFLHKAIYRVKTAHGTSHDNYSHSDSVPLHGPGQGSRMAPAIWVFVSTLLMQCLAVTTGLKHSNPQGTVHIHRHIEGFVDDTSLCVNKWHSDDNIVLQLATMAQEWEKLLYFSGGKLELPKCHFYHLQYRFDNLGHPHISSTIPPVPLQLTDSTTGRVDTITPLANQTAEKYLGIMMAPDNTYAAQTQMLLTKARTFAAQLRRKQCTRAEANIFAQCIYRPAITYGAAATSLSKTQCDKIQRTVLGPLLSAMGFNAHIPVALRHAPYELGGVALPDLFVEQGVDKSMQLIRQLRIPGNLHDQLTIYLDWYHIVLGFEHHITTASQRYDIQYTASPWLSTLHTFLADSHCKILLPDTIYKVRKRRQNDVSIMFVAQQLHCKLKAVNSCRLFLKVESLADITNAAGTTLQQQVAQGLPPTTKNTIQHWPVQPFPPPAAWALWRQFLAQVYGKNNRLATPLGDWTNLDDREFQYKYYAASGTVTSTSSSGTVHYKIHSKARTRWQCRLTTPVTVESSWVPVDVISDSTDSLVIAPPPQWSIQDRYRTTWQDYLLRYTKPPNGFVHDEAIVVSDGGYQPGTSDGTYGWVLITPGEYKIAEGYGRAQGEPMDSFRAEAYGMLAALVYLQRYNLHYRYLTLATDSNSLIQRLQQRQTTNSTTFPHGDVVLAILQLLPESHTLKHVKGHQDRLLPLHKLDTFARFNVRADNLATQAFQIASPDKFHPLPPAVYLVRDEVPIVAREQSTLRHQYNATRHKKYIIERYNMDDDSYDYINWAALAAARRATPHLATFVTKIMHHWLPVLTRQHKQQASLTSLCPRCNTIPETQIHLFQCTHNDDETNYVGSILDHLREQQTPADLTNTIMLQITKSTTTIDDNRVDYYDYILYGIIPAHWQHTIDRTDTPRAASWSKNLIIALWTAAHTIWQQRNEALHENATPDLDADITNLYNKAQSLETKDKSNILRKTLDDLLQQSKTHKEGWVEVFRPVIQQLTKRQQVSSDTADIDTTQTTETVNTGYTNPTSLHERPFVNRGGVA